MLMTVHDNSTALLVVQIPNILHHIHYEDNVTTTESNAR